MSRKNKIMAAVLAAFLSFGTGTLNAAEEPSELNADTVEYDMRTGLITATGDVLLKHGSSRATGARGYYNVKTMEALLEGNVIAVKEDLRITCSRVMSNGKGHMFADGDVRAVKQDQTFQGDHVDFYPEDRNHVVIPAGARVTSKDGVATADHMEGWLDEEYYVGTGNVHMISPTKNMEAGGDRLDYYGKTEKKAVLTGKAWAYKDNDVLRGNRLTVYLADEEEPQVQAEQ